MSNSIDRSSGGGSTSTSTGASPGGLSSAIVDGTSPAGGSSGGVAAAASAVGQVSPDPQQQQQSSTPAVDPSWSRRGLERLSGLKEFGFEVLSRRQRHERDKSGGTSSSRSQQQEPRSPEAHKASPPYSRSTTADGDPRSPDSGSTATASTPASAVPTSTIAAVNPAPDLPARPPPQASHSSSNSASNMNYSSNSRSPGPLSAGSTSSMKKPTFVLVTQDHESLAKVDIANLGSPAAIRERLYTKAHIPDDDFQHCTLHLSSLDQVDPGTSLDDGEIWQICQGVVSGELVPAPLFYVRMSVDQSAGNASNNGGSSSSRSSNQYSSASPEYQYTPSSPFFPHGQSPFGDHAAAPVAGPSNPRPDSRHDTSSNSSVSATRRPPSRSHYSRSNTQDLSLASPLRTEQQQQAQHQQLPSSSSSHRPHSANHSPQPPHSSFFEPDRRASAEQGFVRDRAHHHTSRSHDYVDQQQQQHQQQQQYHQAWERRSSAGTSDYSDRPEWLERPSQLRRQERQSHSESSHPRPQWDPRDMPPPPPRQPVTVQQVGVGPSGPIYRSMAAAPSSSSSRPRANSASNGDTNFDQPYPSHQGRPTSSSGRSQPPPFNGTPHFPQPHHHHDPVASSSSRRQQNLSELPPHLQPASSRNDHNLNSVRSMGDLRGNPSNYGRMGPSPPGGMPPPSSSSGMPHTSRSPYAPPPTLYEDPRYGSQPMRVGASDMGRPSSQVVSPRNTFQHSLSPPPSHPQARMPPTNTSPRIPSYPPAVQRLPPPLHPSQMPRPGSAQQRGYPAPPVAHRRPSYEQMQRPMVVPPQLLAGPQRIPLQPGETVQESLQGQQYSQRQARHSGGSTHTSPRHSQTTFEPLPPSHPSHQHQHHHHHQHQQQQQSQPQPLHHHSQQLPSSYAGRAHSYEERARPFSAQEAHFRGQPQPNNNASRPQFVQQDSFTSSPPLQSNENYLYEQQAFDYATPRHNTDNGRRTPGVSYTSPQFFEVHRSTGDVNSEHPQSPASSRLSTSSDAQSLDKSAHRPESYSSNSTNEVPTPASDRVEKPRRLPYEPHEIKPPQLASLDIVPHVVDQDDVYEGVEILRESIDAATIDDEEKGQSQYDSRPTTADASARPEAGEEATSTIQASEWANLISRINEKGEGSDGDTLGKSSKRQSIEKSDEESSTLGKSKPSPLALDKRVAETADKKPAKVEEAKAASPFVMPTPAITYNPDDDDDDEVMTWAVQMKPTKKPEETPAKITEEVTSPQKQKTSASSSTSAHVGRTEPPKHISIPSSALIENASVSPRVERPALKLQIDMLGPNGTPPQKHSPLPHAVPTSHSSKSHKSNHTSVSALVSSEKQPSSASPRSAARRHRQSSKDSLSAEETNAASSTSTHHSHHSHGQRKTSDNSRIDAPSNDASRRPSFDNNDWAFRPPVEQVYENLEDFFPGHDLDKPIVDVGASGSNSAVSSPAQESAPFISPTRVKAAVDEERSSPSTVTQPHAHAATSTETEPLLSRKEKDSSAREADSARRFNHNRKSMRMVAHDRKIRMKREETLNKAAAVPSSSKDANALKLARRKSTKVWGRKIEEVTAAEADLLHSARTDASERDELAPIKWVKGELIGKGTYGHVYIGFNVTNGEMIAVKQVELPRTASDKEDNRQLSVIEALKSEMELLKDLEHEKIVSYLGFEETPSHLSILLEYVPGGSVGRCLRKYGKFDVQVIQFFTTQILEGLEYLHARGILHRDLKADNILVKMDGTIKISDFGISKRSNDIYNNNSNMSMQGSIFWMAPEVVHNQRKGYSAKIDIWSLGCVVLEMFAGRRPWDSEEAIQAMFKLGAERLAPPVPKDVVLTNQSSHFLKECFHGEADRRPTASRLLCHKFLTLDKNWDFRTCSLAKAMSATS